MKMQIWLIAQESRLGHHFAKKHKQNGPVPFLWFDFIVCWSVSIEIWFVLTICHTKWTLSKRESGA